MSKCIMIGCDLHDDSIVLKIGVDRQEPDTRCWKTAARDRSRMIADLKRRAAAAGCERIVFAYEASGAGFGLHDQLQAEGIDAYVLAPTKMPCSSRERREKNDDRDALRILELVRAHVLAGNRLPSVWVPDPQLRDDREIVRMRLDVGNRLTCLKVQIQSLLKRHSTRRPPGVGGSWTKAFRRWIHELTMEPSETTPAILLFGTRQTLASLLRQLEFFEEEQERLDWQVMQLANSPRYVVAVQKLGQLVGVGLLGAMVFLTEIGDLHRFSNRRQLASYLGLTPTSDESGKANDRKGHISRQGSPRVRKILCQASWVRIRYDAQDKAAYERINAKNPKKKKIGIVAGMRRLGIRMWHAGKSVSPPPKTGKVSVKSPSWAVSGFFEASSGCPKEREEGCRPLRKQKCPGKSRSHSRGG